MPAPASPQYRLEYRQVSKTYRLQNGTAVDALVDVSLQVKPREIVAVVGPSGCGKSTLLSLGAGLERPTRGSVLVDGAEVSAPPKTVAFMLQKDLLLPWRTIQSNVEYGMELQKVDPAERKRRSSDLIARFGLGRFADAYPSQLSGGMRQRAALARTMALEPELLLLDEPFSALDAQTKMTLQGELSKLVRASGLTALLITHDLTEAVVLADRIYVMSNRPGQIVSEVFVNLPPLPDPVERNFMPSTVAYVRQLWAALPGHHL